MQRRTLLKLGATSAVLLAAVGGAAAWIRPGLVRGRLTATGREIFRAVAISVLDKTLQEGFGLVSCSETAIEAFAVLYPADRVALLYCRARSHRQGRGKQLLQALEEQAIKQGVRQLRTEASYISQPLFESLGWITEQKEHLLIGGIAFERFLMGKTL
jgi:GNAT superfamily N-acetyltransferase